MESTLERIALATADGASLAAHRFAPHGACRGVVVLAAAMGVRQDYYFPFARFLAERGFAVLCFDYRGIGYSAPPQLRGYAATIDDWARRDCDGVLQHAKLWQPQAPLFLIGHSLGGQLAGLIPSRHLLDGLITVATGSGYWRENVPRLKRTVWLLWYFILPLYTAIAGYFPGRRVRKVGDLPKGVAYQWSRWCRDPDYLVGVEGPAARQSFAELRCPILSVSFTDDEMMSARNTESLHGFYANAPKHMRRIAPQQLGVERIGHFGFFRDRFRDSLWQDAVAWMLGLKTGEPA